jgi:hypothetical protein
MLMPSPSSLVPPTCIGNTRPRRLEKAWG